jgi:class 3 adenylate cyclase
MSEIRKLVAILVADGVGYSRLAGADEDRTLARLLAARLARAPEVFAQAQTWSVAQKENGRGAGSAIGH